MNNKIIQSGFGLIHMIICQSTHKITALRRIDEPLTQMSEAHLPNQSKIKATCFDFTPSRFSFFFLQDFFIKQISDLLFIPFVLFIISFSTI